MVALCPILLRSVCLPRPHRDLYQVIVLVERRSAPIPCYPANAQQLPYIASKDSCLVSFERRSHRCIGPRCQGLCPTGPLRAQEIRCRHLARLLHAIPSSTKPSEYAPDCLLESRRQSSDTRSLSSRHRCAHKSHLAVSGRLRTEGFHPLNPPLVGYGRRVPGVRASTVAIAMSVKEQLNRRSKTRLTSSSGRGSKYQVQTKGRQYIRRDKMPCCLHLDICRNC